MANTPYNVEFCRAIECENLKEDGQCKKPPKKCIHNMKWIIYWETHGTFPPENGT